MIIDRFLLERRNDSKELLMDCLIPPACCPLVFFGLSSRHWRLITRGLPSTSTAKVNALMAIIYKESPTESMCLERFGRATKLRSHARKKFSKINYSAI